MKIKIDKRYKNVVVEIYDNENDDSPQVLIFKGENCIATKYQTLGKELQAEYKHIEKDVEVNEENEKTLIIRAFRE